MMILIKFTLILFFVLIANPSISAEWVEIDLAEAQIDKSSIITNKSGNVVVMLRHIVENNFISVLSKYDTSKDYSNYSYNIAMVEFNCNDKTYLLKEDTFYSENDSVIHTSIHNSKFKSVVPDSIGDIRLKYACKYRNIKVNKKNKGVR